MTATEQVKVAETARLTITVEFPLELDVMPDSADDLYNDPRVRQLTQLAEAETMALFILRRLQTWDEVPDDLMLEAVDTVLLDADGEVV